MLLWAVCSLFLLSTALVVVTSSVIRAAHARRSTEQRLVALGIAEREMERVKAMPLRDLPDDGRHAATWDGVRDLPAGRGCLGMAPGPLAGTRQITVSVQWQDATGPERTVLLAALRSPHGR